MQAQMAFTRCEMTCVSRGLVVAFALVIGPIWFCASARCDEQNEPTVAMKEHLAAGEFGPALKLARQSQDKTQRDALLQEIAAAQATAGAHSGSLHTASEIYDDQRRYESFSTIRAARLAGPQSRGGGPQADFDSLIELITTTIDPDTWDEVGGDGSIAPFETGVRVDAQGLMSRVTTQPTNSWLARLRSSSRSDRGNQDVRQASRLRKVSLPRLEKQLQILWAQGLPPTEAMQSLAGLQRIQYLMVYPDTGDLVLAGPAGDWRDDGQGRIVAVADGAPVLALDDFVVVLRNAIDGSRRFGCSITPRQENLAQARAYIESTTARPLKPGRRDAWLTQLRDHLGRQDIEVYGIDPRTRTARVIVEADYHMKLIGMGLADGVPGVVSYLDSIHVGPGRAPPPLGVLRWWFALNYDTIHATEQRDAFQLLGSGAKVQSENEMLSQQGQRIHTGKSEELNRLFASNFTHHFDALSSQYPIYAELRNVFDLAMVAALVRDEDLTAQIGWSATHFRNPQAYQIALGDAPKEVETVMNHRVIDRKHVIAGVSGGVAVNASAAIETLGVKTAPYGTLYNDQAEGSAPADLPRDRWWWD